MEKVLIDNDAALKLSQYFLVDEFYQISGGTDHIFILPTLKFRFHLDDDKKALKYTRDETVLEVLRAFVSSVNEINIEPSDAILSEFSDIDGIDPGEAVLFALTASDDQSLTVTGDKRALIALSDMGAAKGISGRLAGRLKCLEQIVAEMLITCHQSEVIRKVSGKHWDTSLRACFSSNKIPSILEGLNNYYCDLNKKCGNLLALFPTAD